MFTFSLLFIAWLLNSLKSPRKRSGKEKLFYTFAFIYGISQFASLVNSPMPFESIKQGIIIFSLLTMMIVISETVLDKKIAISVLTAIGIASLVIGTIAVVNYYFFTDFRGRLGQKSVLGIVDLGGDPYYFGDLLLYSLGSVLFVILNLSKKKYWRWLRWPLLMIWFSAIVLTYTKAILVAVICFFLCLILILKKKRAFVAICMILFIITMIFNFKVPGLYIAANENLLRINIFSPLGGNSLFIRIKAIIVSLSNSMEHFWFGNGAGLSQRLLPKMGNHFDKIVNEKTKIFMKEKLIYGESANISLIDAHNLFITEFFNVGMLGLVSLICLIAFPIIKQIRIIKNSGLKKDDINEFIFATLIAMLFSRLTGSLIVIPSLWFMLGLCFGVSKLYPHPAPSSNL